MARGAARAMSPGEGARSPAGRGQAYLAQMAQNSGFLTSLWRHSEALGTFQAPPPQVSV
jgi:hypothetical protein